MALNKSRLRAQIVFLEVLETQRAEMHARGYQVAARALRATIESELSDVPMEAFMSPELPTLEATAQNVFFESRRRFADMEGNGHAARAQFEADRLFDRLRLRRRRH